MSLNVSDRSFITARIRATQSQLDVRRSSGAAVSQMLHDSNDLEPGELPVKRRGDHDLNQMGMRPKPPLTPAAVLVPLLDHGDQITVLLTERAADLRAHAGQISFPGGRIDPGDASPEAAALREANEEIGLPLASVELVGRLDTYEVRTGFEITPVVGFVDPVFKLIRAPGEVADVFEVPLAFVLDPANHERQSKVLQGKRRYFYVLPFEDRYIWGATAGMLVNLYEVLTGQTAYWR
ncbi:MAG: CoA pyrophosphatase [Alphaproteobacteria bacterium]|nr:CoA pyrophosphatase [Alphaproteobacteria bacterium]